MEIISEKHHINYTISEDDSISGAEKIVSILRSDWPVDELQNKVFTNGITNKLIGIYYHGHYNDMVLVRIYGNKTDLLIDRRDEVRNIKIMNKAGYTHSLYATFNNGLAYEFLPGEILTPITIKKYEIYCLIAKRLAQMHRLNPSDYFPKIDNYYSVREPIIWRKIERFMELMPKKFDDPIKQSRFEAHINSYEVLSNEYKLLKDNLTQLNSPIVYAHNDLLLTNILYDEHAHSVTFIDFEYTGFNYQAFDIANHFAEFAGVDDIDYSRYPDEVYQRSWLRIYLQAFKQTSNISEDDVTLLFKQINKFVLLAHFLWGCWALIQCEHSTIDFDFLKFAAIRFDEYFKRKSCLGDD